MKLRLKFFVGFEFERLVVAAWIGKAVRLAVRYGIARSSQRLNRRRPPGPETLPTESVNALPP